MTITHETSTDITVHIINGFVSDGTGGNPAGVVLDADKLDEAQMLKIAGQIGLSETAFVSKSDKAGFRLDFFTPNRRIAHCGHATIAAFAHMSATNLVADGITSKDTVDGPRKIIIDSGTAFMEQLAPVYSEEKDWKKEQVTNEAVLESLGLTREDLLPEGAPVRVNTGNSFMLIGIKSIDILKKIQPDQQAIHGISDALDLIGYYVFTTDTPDHDATTRMFAPRYAIEEEAATGMAAGPLASLLHDRLGFDKVELVIEQGKYMPQPSPSVLNARLSLENGKITGLMVGGEGKAMSSKTISLTN